MVRDRVSLVVRFGKETIRAFRADDLQGRAAEVAYHLLFSIIPLLIFLTALSSLLGRAIGTEDAVRRVTDWIFAHLPDSTAAAVADPVRTIIEHEQPELLSFGALLTLWSARNAIAALMKALNRTFAVDDQRSWLRRTLIALALTLALGVAVVISSALLVAGRELGHVVADLFGLGGAWESVWAWLRWPLVALALAVALAVLYWAGPDTPIPFSWLTPGSVLAVVLLSMVTYGFGLYVRYATGWAGPAYGALGGILAFAFWLYLLSLIILLGAELNAVLARHQAGQSGMPAAATCPGAQPQSRTVRCHAPESPREG
ncbi:MAG: hypothetical protein C4346_18010 [Chloroflexota bacterium]